MHDEAARLLLGMFAATGIMISLGTVIGVGFGLMDRHTEASSVVTAGLIVWLGAASAASYLAIEEVMVGAIIGGVLVLFGLSGFVAAGGLGMQLGSGLGQLIKMWSSD